MAVVLLAGGEGRRIGGGKPLRLLGGRTLLARALEAAAGWSDTVAVAVRDPGQASGLGNAQLVLDDPAIEGPLGGLASALRFARGRGRDAVLTLPCDMPFLPNDLLQRLSAAMGDRNAAIAASGGSLHPVCGLWRTAALAALPEHAASGGRSLRGFAKAVGYAEMDWPTAPADPFFNVNREEDLARAARLLKGLDPG